jgi:nucleoside-diphosphate-sugar epimerase
VTSVPQVRVARLSSVYGAGMQVDTFLGQLLHAGLAAGAVVFPQSAEAASDYINIAAVVQMLPAIAIGGQHRLYNVASGINTRHAVLAEALRAIAGWRVSFAPEAPTGQCPRISVARLVAEFGPTSSDIVADLPALLTFVQERHWRSALRHLAA